MTNNCVIRDQKIQPVLSIRGKSAVQDLPQFFGRAYGEIMRYLGELGEHPAGMPFAAYYNMDMQNLDIEAGFPVNRRLPDKGDIRYNEIPAGKVAACIHLGPYSEMVGSYNALNEFIMEQGYIPSGVAYEYYFNDPKTVPPEEIKTEIVFPVVRNNQ